MSDHLPAEDHPGYDPLMQYLLCTDYEQDIRMQGDEVVIRVTPEITFLKMPEIKEII